MRRTRVRNRDFSTFDIHDRAELPCPYLPYFILRKIKEIVLEINLDTSISSVMDYFEIFMERMMLCRRAAEKLGLPILCWSSTISVCCKTKKKAADRQPSFLWYKIAECLLYHQKP